MKVLFRLCFLLAISFTTVYAMAIPREEYPRPQFERHDWINLNGPWSYTFDFAQTGIEKGFPVSSGFDGTIIVPFCPESELSGVGHKDFINSIWYQRAVTIPEAWKGKDVMLNFGAVYYTAEVYVNGHLAAIHRGGSSPFCVNISPYANVGTVANIVVHATSDLRSAHQGAGKQSLQSASNGCNYTRTSGIWQTVWMEPVAKGALKNVSVSTDIKNGRLIIHPYFNSPLEGGKFFVEIKDKGKKIASTSTPAGSNSIVYLDLKNMKLWDPGAPYIYDITYRVKDRNGNIIDEVESYVGIREVEIKGNQIYINGKPCFQRLVLDQGFYPDGIWTAPSDSALRNDIELSMAAGFNGARLHQKVFEPRFHYWADKLGYITWGEAPSWGMDANDRIAEANFTNEWREIVERDKSHPSIIIWTPLNEEWWPDTRNYPVFVTDLYDLTKSIDPSRPVNDASGGCHIKTDIWTVHTYEQNPEILSRQLFNPDVKGNYADKFMQLHHSKGTTVMNIGFNGIVEKQYTFPVYDGKMPFIVDEFGGIKWTPGMTENTNTSWGYGDSPKSEEEYIERLEGQVKALINLNDNIAGYCYTQLTDVEQEQNGIFNYDRTPKFNMEKIKAIFNLRPEFEKK